MTPDTSTLDIPLSAHHLRFTVRAQTPIVFNDFKGSALRGAFVSVMRRTFCPEWRADKTDPLHRSLCPVCQLLTLENDDLADPAGRPGDVRRPYAIQPPPGDQTHYAPGDTFCFGLTLFGDTLTYLPYLVLTAGGMGDNGVGKKDESGRRGTFTVEQIDAVHPLRGALQPMLEPDGRMVQPRTIPVLPADVLDATASLTDQLTARDNHLRIDWLTPTRITQRRELWQDADFFAFGKQVVLRILDLCAQHGGGRPTIDGQPLEVRRDIYPHLNSVELIADQTRWWDVQGYSDRIGRQQRLGGVLSSAVYRAPDWGPLLPWLIWGMSTQVGKNIVKGCGIYQLAAA